MNATDQNRRNRLILLSIAGIPVTMILAATWLWYFVVQGDLDLVGALGTANRGKLVQPPRLLDAVELYEQGGDVVRYADLEPKWTMLVPASGGRCDAVCEHSLYLTRQIHVALGKEFNRLRRIYISEAEVNSTTRVVASATTTVPAPADFPDFLETEHSGLKPLVMGAGAYAQLFGEHEADAGTWYLADPGGWIMMSYNAEVSYKDVIADLKFLLKNSSK